MKNPSNRSVEKINERLRPHGQALTKDGERLAKAWDVVKRRATGAVVLTALATGGINIAHNAEKNEPLSEDTAGAVVIAEEGDTVFDIAKAVNGKDDLRETIDVLESQSPDLSDEILNVGDKVFLTNEQQFNLEEARRDGETRIEVIDLSGEPIDINIGPAPKQ